MTDLTKRLAEMIYNAEVGCSGTNALRAAEAIEPAVRELLEGAIEYWMQPYAPDRDQRLVKALAAFGEQP